MVQKSSISRRYYDHQLVRSDYTAPNTSKTCQQSKCNSQYMILPADDKGDKPPLRPAMYWIAGDGGTMRIKRQLSARYHIGLS
ncbi:MAG: hypothetical protein U0T36_10935 [Saprospiraceae bacterium]